MLSPLLKKAEEKAGVKKDESPDSKSGSPPVKKLCTVYSKQLARLPQGDQTLVKDLLTFIDMYKDEKCNPHAHPAHLILDLLGTKHHDSNRLHAGQLESWYREYTNMRNNPALFKESVEIGPSSDGETVKMPITCLKLVIPGDGLPSTDDWLGCLESMIFGGINLGREPIDGSMNLPNPQGNTNADMGSVDIIKGFTRATCVATLLAAAAELDIGDPSTLELLKPIHHILDKCWLVPVHVTLGAGEIDMSFRNLKLSYQGSERQPPNNLQIALRFSRAIELNQQDGTHPQQWSTEDRLRDVVNRFHITTGLTARHRVDEDKFKSILNLIQGTCSQSRDVIAQHLDRHKWRECAFSSEQLKSTRWVIGTAPKMAACPMKKSLTVTPESQVSHLELVVQSFVDAGRKLRPSARAKMRLNQDQFDRYCDFACVYASVLAEARQLSSWTQEKENNVKKLFFQKDYFAEIEAAISSKLQTWQLTHLSLWNDYIEPRSTSTVVPDEDIMAMEDEATAAKFREIKAKIATDTATMTRFNAQEAATAKRLHVVEVMHQKGQNQIGKELVENHMEKCHKVLHVTDLKAVPQVDAAYRLLASQMKVSTDDIQTVVYCDCTKFGVMTRPEVNALGEFLEKTLFRNPYRSVAIILPPLLYGSTAGGSLRSDWRRIEDKLVNNCRIELRNFVVNLNMQDIHKNRELPAAFLCWIGVPDSTLPNKATAHRALRTGGEAPPGQVNVFCASDLWQRQALHPAQYPVALQEKEFVVPGENFVSHDGRRNLTDLQETSQWLGGQNVVKAILGGLLGLDEKKIKPTLILHPTAYDGAVELAAVSLGMMSISCTTNHIYWKTAVEMVKSSLLQAWKDGKSPMDKALPRYKKEIPAEEIPVANSRPNLTICQIVDSRLIMPRDIRQQFLCCPIWGGEWRAILQQFDRDWGCHSEDPAPQGPVVIDEGATSPFMPNEPVNLEKLKEKYGDPLAEIPVPESSAVLLLMTGPALFLLAKEALVIKPSNGPIILHGAGTWLTNEKATKFESEHPGKAVPCRFDGDTSLVVLEENGSDSSLMSLREVLQKVERGGAVDYTLGGHRCERPPQVQQGHADDQFIISADPESPLLWRPSAIAMRNLKANNVASQFSYTQLAGSALKLVWRIRFYPGEKCVAAAKPLWYVSSDLEVAKDECKRLV